MRKYILLFLSLIVFGCGAGMIQQEIGASYKLSPGMTKEQVVAILGPPIKSDFDRGVEEWFYCKTGGVSFQDQMNMSSVDEHVALFFHEGKLLTKTNYSVTPADTRGHYGSCELFIKQGNYREPDEVIEIRRR